MNVLISLQQKDAGDFCHYRYDMKSGVPFSSLLLLSLPACFYTDIRDLWKSNQAKMLNYGKEWKYLPEWPKTNSRWPNMMSGSEAATADTVPPLSPSLSLSLFLSLFGPLHYSSSALIIKHTMPSLWSLPSKPESTREATNPELSGSTVSWGGVAVVNIPTEELSIFMQEWRIRNNLRIWL